ncbi:unnamed protein product [Durusdinium trenchii]|uniref:Calcineurin-like phosphoesterase domain-containing protein n=1 Tax=Durusdinium trenchii TaxID=1381693 RepID=A0ABP0MBQ0_9DINO
MISSTNGQVCSGVPSVFLPSFLPSFRNRLGFPRASRWRTTRGDLETFRRYVDSGHSVLRRVGTGASSLQLCSDQAAFVFGGDLFDRGPGDLQLAKELVGLKQRYPDRVFLLMGNRDINKMRLTAELSDYAMNRTPSEAFKPWWDNKAMDLVKYLRKDNKEDSRVNRLKWMLHHTLGSPAAFDFRRKELANFSRGLEISDEEVLESFLESVLQPEGAVQSYLRHAQLGLVIGDTLFVHGAAEERALGFVPSHQTRYVKNKREDLLKLPGSQKGLDLRQWIDALNRFAEEEVNAWCLDPGWQPCGRRGGEALMAYQSRPAMALSTVVVSSYVDGKNMPTRKAIDKDVFEGQRKCSDPLSKTVVEYLLRGGVRRVVVGHKPCGEAPAVLRTETVRGGYEVISGDTNYASIKDERHMRGGAWCEVRLSLGAVSSQARLRGALPDSGERYDVRLMPLGKSDGWPPGDPRVGRQAKVGQEWLWVRLKLENGTYLLSSGRNRSSNSTTLKAADFEVTDPPPALMKS